MMKKNKFINIKCTEKQALLIEIALETLCRMTCGQLASMVDGMSCMKGKSIEGILPNGEKASFYQLGSYIEDILKPILFPELHRNASYGVGQKEIGDAQIAYEMVKKLQNYRVRDLKDKWRSVLHDEPLHYSKEPLIEVNEI